MQAIDDVQKCEASPQVIEEQLIEETKSVEETKEEPKGTAQSELICKLDRFESNNVCS